MRLLTILGVRPEIIRLSRIITKFDEALGEQHLLLNTNQNFEPSLNEIFFQQLQVRKPDYQLELASKVQAQQIGKMLGLLDKAYDELRPDAILILGDTNTDLAAVLAAKHHRKINQRGLPVFHLEAGNRCFDKEVPEETNRKVVDHLADWNLTYTYRAEKNLHQESLRNMSVMGNPMREIIDYYRPQIDASKILAQLKLEGADYVFVTLHRSENVDQKQRFSACLEAVSQLAQKHNLQVIFSTHPRARDKLEQFNFSQEQLAGINFIEPTGFFDCIHLTENAKLVASDSGTIPEEASILNVPNIMLREATERTELLDAGCSILAGASCPVRILAAAELMLARHKQGYVAQVPIEYTYLDVSEKVRTIVLSRIASICAGQGAG